MKSKIAALSPGLAVLAVFALATSATSAHASHFREQAYRYQDCEGKPALVRFPLFADGSSAAGTMIDHYTHMAFLRVAPPARPSPAPLALGKESLLDGHAEDLQAKVREVFGGRVVELSFFWRQCDLVVDSASVVYQFDAGTGRLIAERDLFTPDGTAMVQRLLYQERRARLTKEVRRQERRIAQAKNKPDRQRAERTKELYERCLDDRFGAEKRPERDASLGLATLSETAITFEASECATQEIADLDELGRFVNRLEPAKLRPYLSAYGRYVFFGEGKAAIPADTAAAQFFHGKVGDASVTLYLGADSSGAYFYDKYRTLIRLAVQPLDAGHYVFEERDAEEKVTAVFAVTVVGTRLQGTWRGGSKRLPVDASRQ
jgi:hypothetical protein